MARPVRVEYPGAVYHVITRGNNRRPVFRDDQDRSRYLEKLFQYCEGFRVRLLCYCLLSNHVHLLLETVEGNLSKMMQAFQTSYTMYFNRRHGRTGHVFEQRYKAFLVDKDNYLLQVSRYIHLNPISARVVERPQDYRWSSYRGYVDERVTEDTSREEVLGQLGGKGREGVMRYREFVEGGLKRGEEWDKVPVIRQAFVGEEEFVERAIKKFSGGESLEGRYGFSKVVGAVCEVVGLEGRELKRSVKDARVQTGRELLMYLARRHGGASLADVARYLEARDISTVSHGVRRAEHRLESEKEFRRKVEQVLKLLANSRIQA